MATEDQNTSPSPQAPFSEMPAADTAANKSDASERSTAARVTVQSTNPAECTRAMLHTRTMQQLLDSVLSTQRQLQGLLAGHMLDLFGSVDRFTIGMAVAVALGLIHALTPGHGKAVIFSHFLGQRADMLAGMRVAAVTALTHGMIAVLLVLVAGRVITPLGRPTGAAAWLEVIAGLIVAAVGALYVVFSVRGVSARRRPRSRHEGVATAAGGGHGAASLPAHHYRRRHRGRS
jgi:ABC-type nickel/cobalt efflux system permease component RcnA